MAFSRDARTLAPTADDETIRLWDVRSRKPVGEPLTGHFGNALDVAFGRDGRTLASAGSDDTIRLWDLRIPK